ncbi:MAG: hypothetical protein ACK5LJ_13285 [Paracoccus sp. (in: a-proteobacteria)]
MILPRIILPWTKMSDLSQNSRLHWSKQRRLKKAQKHAADGLARAAGWHLIDIPDDAEIVATLTYCPPPGTVYPDDDNVVAAHKSARDALAAVLRINDSRFRSHAVPGGRCKLGAVIIDARATGSSWKSIGVEAVE